MIDIRTLALNQVGYLGSGFAYLFPDVSGTGVRSTPSTYDIQPLQYISV